MLVVGGLSFAIVARVVPVLAPVWLTGTATVAFVVAGYRTGEARVPAAQGAVAALCGYLLVLPLVLMSPAARDLGQIALTALAALAVGAVTGVVRVRRAGRSGSARHRQP